MAWLGDKPVYSDQVRKLADITTEVQPQTWKPANVAAQKLFRCVECLRDLELLLQTAGRSKTKEKRRRRLKILLTPLHSLVEAIRDLANDLENNPSTASRLPAGSRQLVNQMRSQLLRISTIEKGGLLSISRNKISAHVDRELSAEEMQGLLTQANPSQVGMWLHTCVAVLSDFIKLPAYFWSCNADGEKAMRILFVEPFVVTLGLDSAGKAKRLLDVHMVAKPPRRDVLELLMRVIKNSKWMFGPKDFCIRKFVPDEPADSWARSLRWLPQVSGSKVKNCGPSIVPKIDTASDHCLLIPANAPFFVNGSVQQIAKREDLEGCQ